MIILLGLDSIIHAKRKMYMGYVIVELQQS